MGEMSDMHKLINAMKLAKRAQVGMELAYFDVIELLGELDSLKSYIAELEAEVTKCHELQDSYCDRPIEDALRAERDRAREMVTRLIEAGRPLCDYAILVSFDHPMGDGQMALNDKSAWDALVTEWQKERETC